MNKKIILSFFLCAGLLQANAQMPPANAPMSSYKKSLPMPDYIARAFTNGTRNLNGRPGKKYWLNHGRYTIALTVNPPQNTVTGVEQITWFNESPDKLDSLNMKLIMNTHRGAARGATANPQAGIQVDEITVNGVKTAWNNDSVSSTNYMMALQKPLAKHDSVRFNIRWHYQLSRGRGREGIIDPTTFYIAYFYPRVSVYDDYKGWDVQPFGGGLEFYNDFNDYNLSVTVPKNFIVWATGNFRNPDEVLSADAAKRFQTSLTSDSTIHVAGAKDLANKTVTAQNTSNTWKFTASNVSDVAIGISDHYNWDAGSVVTDDQTGRRVSMQAAYQDTMRDFQQSVQFGRYSLRYFSNDWPGVQYPYEKSIAFQGFADMEFPMMMNNSHQADLGFAQLVQDHEQAHTYMPFYMGTNESFYAFMDEGWATTFEYLIGLTEKGKKGADDFYKSFRVNRWIHGPHTQENPVITPSPYVTFAAGSNSYGKASLSYLALKDMLGDELFKKALHTYMNNWNGKHPLPWDYFNSMSAGSGKKLNWFFENWFFTPSYIDLGLESTVQTKRGYSLSVKNIGGFAVPFDVNVTYTDGSMDVFHQTPVVWKKDQKITAVTIRTTKTVKSITLDGGIFMDADEKNNTWTK
ncbi:MAG: hypothetical protein JWQ30_1869 [Sediminibacterium sp.]|nr:hypothetical protein [Sediminibacterium sp.]